MKFVWLVMWDMQRQKNTWTTATTPPALDTVYGYIILLRKKLWILYIRGGTDTVDTIRWDSQWGLFQFQRRDYCGFGAGVVWACQVQLNGYNKTWTWFYGIMA
jgi:hypothetical protein